MIGVHIIRDKTGFIWQVAIEGHAGFAEEGRDIVCAAVSVTAYTAAGALEELAGLKNCYQEKHGYMLISLPQDLTDEQKMTAKIILETTAIGLKQIEMGYKTYISVLDEEV
jgi:uncharacterized protein YsxB (DUF464 family)